MGTDLTQRLSFPLLRHSCSKKYLWSVNIHQLLKKKERKLTFLNNYDVTKSFCNSLHNMKTSQKDLRIILWRLLFWVFKFWVIETPNWVYQTPILVFKIQKMFMELEIGFWCLKYQFWCFKHQKEVLSLL